MFNDYNRYDRHECSPCRNPWEPPFWGPGPGRPPFGPGKPPFEPGRPPFGPGRPPFGPGRPGRPPYGPRPY